MKWIVVILMVVLVGCGSESVHLDDSGLICASDLCVVSEDDARASGHDANIDVGAKDAGGSDSGIDVGIKDVCSDPDAGQTDQDLEGGTADDCGYGDGGVAYPKPCYDNSLSFSGVSNGDKETQQVDVTSCGCGALLVKDVWWGTGRGEDNSHGWLSVKTDKELPVQMKYGDVLVISVTCSPVVQPMSEILGSGVLYFSVEIAGTLYPLTVRVTCRGTNP